MAQYKADVPVPAVRVIRNLPLPLIQGKDLGVKVIRVGVTGKDVQGLILRKGRELPLCLVKQQRHRGQLRQKSAVSQKGDGYHFSFTAVP